MRALLTGTCGVLLALALAHTPAQSQTAKPTTEQQLKTLKEQNQKLLEQQAASLQKLDEVMKDAQQLRTLARRT